MEIKLKHILLILFIFTSSCANAQWMAVTTINKVTTVAGEDLKPGEVYDLDVCPGTKRNHINITDKLGIGYMVKDKVIIGIARTGKDENDEWNYDVFARYNINNATLADLWVICEYNYLHSQDDKYTDHINLGLMYSLEVWNSFYLEPNYTKSMKDGEEGQFNIGLSYIF
tara:strand:+ start:272 stop:781 length:510 start_codon:yes stop_codon:yes gene_type:complete